MKAQALGALLVMFVGTNAVAQAWPTVALPEDARAFSVGEQIVANGTPMRVQVFISNRSPAEVAAWFRHSLGEPIVENKVQDKLVLGRQAGDFYETVQLETSAGG